jgi:predicted DNA-binding ribbon-helix-helix protein
MKSPVIKRSILLAGHKTSVSLEEAFWQGLKEIAGSRAISVSALIGSIDARRVDGNLSSGIRLFVLDHYRGLAHARAAEAIAPPNGPVIGEALRATLGPTPLAFRRTA